MADDPQTNFVIPEETKKKFPKLIPLILASESMNDEERQYWINILPVMTEEQIASLLDILETEKKQLAEIDKKYEKEMENLGSDEMIQEMKAKRREKRESRKQEETAFEQKEQQEQEKLLQEIEGDSI